MCPITIVWSRTPAPRQHKANVAPSTAYSQHPTHLTYHLTQKADPDFLVPGKIKVARLRRHDFQIQQCPHTLSYQRPDGRCLENFFGQRRSNEFILIRLMELNRATVLTNKLNFGHRKTTSGEGSTKRYPVAQKGVLLYPKTRSVAPVISIGFAWTTDQFMGQTPRLAIDFMSRPALA